MRVGRRDAIALHRSRTPIVRCAAVWSSPRRPADPSARRAALAAPGDSLIRVLKEAVFLAVEKTPRCLHGCGRCCSTQRVSGLRDHLRISLPRGTSAVEVRMLPQRQALAGLGSADPFHRAIISVRARAVGQIVMRVGRMVNAVLATTCCATLEADNLRDKSRVFE
jgi:hypothetical protein